mmetsp:Transcript_19858/g.40175  ORF Transcript_19858/g.40175 Transcript_19858/m.40175 type:complete len:258 (-) Transcript_19858:19-792(-)
MRGVGGELRGGSGAVAAPAPAADPEVTCAAAALRVLRGKLPLDLCKLVRNLSDGVCDDVSRERAADLPYQPQHLPCPVHPPLPVRRQHRVGGGLVCVGGQDGGDLADVAQTQGPRHGGVPALLAALRPVLGRHCHFVPLARQRHEVLSHRGRHARLQPHKGPAVRKLHRQLVVVRVHALHLRRVVVRRIIREKRRLFLVVWDLCEDLGADGRELRLRQTPCHRGVLVGRLALARLLALGELDVLGAGTALLGDEACL